MTAGALPAGSGRAREFGAAALLTAVAAVAGLLAASAQTLALLLVAIALLMVWTALCSRRPAVALGVIAAFILFSSHVFALLYSRQVLAAEQLRPLLALKDVLGAVLVLVLTLRHRADPRARRVLYAAVPLVLYLLANVAVNSGHVPLEARLLGLRGLLVPVIGLLAGVLLSLQLRERGAQLVVYMVAGAALYSLAEYLLPITFLTDGIKVGLYWANVKGQAAFLVGALPGNFFLNANGIRRLSGSFGDPLSAGYVLAACLVVVDRLARRSAWLLLPLAAALLLTFTRGGWIIAACVLAAAYLPQVLRGRHAPFVAGGAVTGVMLLLAVEPLRRFLSQTLSGTDGSSIAHREALTRNLAVDYGVFGDGVGSTGGAVAGQGILEGAEVTESAYSTVLGQIGWVGLLMFAVLIATVIAHVLAPGSRDIRARRGLGLVVGLLITGIFSEQLLAFNSGWLPWALVGLAVAGVHGPQRSGAQQEGSGVSRETAVSHA